MAKAMRRDSYTIEGCFQLTCNVATNCPMGGDSGHGGRTEIELINDCADISVEVVGQDGEQMTCDARSIKIMLGGDMEADAIVMLMRFAAGKLAYAMHGEDYDENTWLRWCGD